MKRGVCFFLCFLSLVILVGCEGKNKEGHQKLSIYYIDADGNSLRQEDYVTQGKEIEEEVGDMLRELKTSTFPQSVKVVDYQLDQNRLALYFNAGYEKMDKGTEVLLRAAVVQSLVQLKGVDYVSFYVDEEPLRNKEGIAIGLMDDETFVQNTGSAMSSYQTTTLKLYFSNKAGTSLRSETLENVRYSPSTSVEKLVVERLMKGPKSDNNSPIISSTTKLFGVSVNEGVCYVNFDSSFLTNTYNQKPEVTIYSIVNSIIQNGTTVNKVQILIDGSTDAVYQNVIDLSRPLEWNPDIIKEK